MSLQGIDRPGMKGFTERGRNANIEDVTYKAV
jgi:hypothetical protein